MKAKLWLPLLLAIHSPLLAVEDDTPAAVASVKQYAQKLNAQYYRSASHSYNDAGAPELALHHRRRAEIIRMGIQKAREIAQKVENGREFCAEIHEWSYDAVRDRYQINLQLMWKLNHAPAHSRGVSGVLSVQADGSDPCFILHREIESAKPPPANMQPVFSWPLAQR